MVNFQHLDETQLQEHIKTYFASLEKALKRFEEIFVKIEETHMEELHDAAIKRFEFSMELFRKLLSLLLIHAKETIRSQREVIEKAYQISLIDNEKQWLMMLDCRNNSSHIYQLEMSEQIFKQLPGFLQIMHQTLRSMQTKYANLIK